MVTSHRLYHVQLEAQKSEITRQYLGRILTEIEAQAKAIALVGPYTTGNLSRSIIKVGPTAVGGKVTGKVGSRLSYAGFVESGAKVHNIFPKGISSYRFGRVRRPALKFYWHGRLVFTNQVPMVPGTIGISHPGQKAKHYLLTPLRNAAVRHRMQLIVYET
jgi:hypothetical protein